MRLFFQRALGGAGAARARLPTGACALLGGLAPDLLTRGRGRLRVDARASRLGEADGDGLLGVAGAVFALANMMHLFADELTGLCRRSLALGAVPLRSF
ncbi:MAG: hypothetical protein K0R38_6988 [Polyangiaceae bacterium]|nr:hypothetical protein [Polyangiaceae bacterium]